MTWLKYWQKDTFSIFFKNIPETNTVYLHCTTTVEVRRRRERKKKCGRKRLVSWARWATEDEGEEGEEGEDDDNDESGGDNLLMSWSSADDNNDDGDGHWRWWCRGWWSLWSPLFLVVTTLAVAVILRGGQPRSQAETSGQSGRAIFCCWNREKTERKREIETDWWGRKEYFR